jgi:hypothetical protein
MDVDASLVESHSDNQGAEPTFKKHIFGLHPIVVSVANTDEVLAVLLRKDDMRRDPLSSAHAWCVNGLSSGA